MSVQSLQTRVRGIHATFRPSFNFFFTYATLPVCAIGEKSRIGELVRIKFTPKLRIKSVAS